MVGSGSSQFSRFAVPLSGLLTRREALRRLGLLGVGTSVGISLLSACGGSSDFVDVKGFGWPDGLIDVWDFGDDAEGGNTVASRVGESTRLTARGTKTVVKDASDPGPFGPSLVLDGKTVFVKDGNIGRLDVTQNGGTEVTVINWVKDTARNHDDTSYGIAFRAGSHCEGGVEPSRQYASYFDAVRYIGSHGHYTPHIGAQDGASPGYPYNHDYAASARKYFTGVGQGVWHMEAFTYDGQKIVAYVDGLADIWKAVPEPPPGLDEPGYSQHETVDRNPYFLGKPINRSSTMKRFTIGGAVSGPDAGSNFTTGKMGGVAVFSRALSASEIMNIRLGTLRPGDAITSYSFEVTSPGPHALNEIGWSARSSPSNTDVSGGTGEDYRISRPSGATKAYLRKASTRLGAAWIPLTGLSNSQVKSVTFAMLSAAPTSAPQRLLVKVDDAWWVSDAVYRTAQKHSGDADWAQAETMTHVLTWNAGQWRRASIDGDVLGLDEKTNSRDIATGKLNAVGFWSDNGDGSVVRVTDLKLYPH